MTNREVLDGLFAKIKTTDAYADIVTGAAGTHDFPAVAAELQRQAEKFGDQSHLPDGTGGVYEDDAEALRNDCDRATKAGFVTWRHILLEEVYEALAEADPAKLRTELIQVAAVALQWVAALDRRAK